MPEDPGTEPPFQLMGRRPDHGVGAGETWVVRGWADEMTDYFSRSGGAVREIAHLDLEEGFVELLRSARPEVWGGRNGTGPDGGGRLAEPVPSTLGEEE
jgi:hypothetical protein